MTGIWQQFKEDVEHEWERWNMKKETDNPIASLNRYIKEAERETEKVSRLTERQRRLVEEFQHEQDEAEHMLDKRKQQAAVVKHYEENELYDIAVREIEQYGERALKLASMKKEAEEQLQTLERRHQEMVYKLKDMRLKRMEWMGRENVARANHNISKLYQENGREPEARFKEVEQYLEGMEQRHQREYEHSTFDERVAHLEKRKTEAEQEKA
ncbi:PspA/IM30 family protein [uncultured Marinococcus sp.]|uniref:PspA/IM30 family protein n=1 Tax=uncultured Marinococcus sp. TaxID=487012 RepID=UPI002631FE56|nr:PspA/IM30 family protein [uncultured Marinococcus sp.]